MKVGDLVPFRSGGRRLPWRHPVNIPVWLEALGLGLLVVALMRPQMGVEKQIQRSRGIDVVLLLDVSGSMRVYDVPESLSLRQAGSAIETGRLKNRLDVAKEELRNFVKRRPDDRIGLIVFSKYPYVVCPPTLDHDFLLNHLQMVTVGMFKDDGTGIAGPLSSGANRLKDSLAKRRVMVLFTDGENNVEAAATPMEAAKIASMFKCKVYSVGIGSDRAVYPASGFFGTQLQRVPNGLDEKLLRQIADETQGRYFAAQDADMFAQVMKEIDSLETIEMKQPKYIDYSERFVGWLLAGCILLLLGVFLENTVLLQAP
jgi:Ca-activated chloride channel family protein